MLAGRPIASYARLIASVSPPVAPSLRIISRNTSTTSSSASRAVLEGDIVLLRRVRNQDYQKLTKPLKPGNKIHAHFGTLDEGDIIGREYLDTVTSSSGEHLRIIEPTLAEYTILTPRQVTPVYPDDASVIVSLLDIHASNSSELHDVEGGSRLEILEAGTGHGALTLHLARAVHASNPPAPSVSSKEELEDALSEWKSQRKAVIHTIDDRREFSAAARKIVSGFRRGLYAGNVDFHVGDVSEFIEKHTGAGRHRPFSHVVLDLPDVHQHIAPAARALRDGGSLLTFCPSVTQIAKCVEAAEQFQLPLLHQSVLELGVGLSGGRQWQVRRAKNRKSARNAFADAESSAGEESPILKDVERWETVCRPSVGHMVVGGGFVSLWRRKRI